MTHDLTPTDQIFCLILPSISEPNLEDHCKQQVLHEVPLPPGVYYRGADKSSARPGRKQATATKLSFASHPKKKIQNVRPNRSPRQQWPPRRTKNGDLSIVFESSRAKDFSASLYCHRVSTQLQLNIYLIIYWTPFLHPEPEERPCRGDRGPHIMDCVTVQYQTVVKYCVL